MENLVAGCGMQYNKMPIVMICDENFVMQTCVALTSLRMNKKNNTIYEVYIIVADCTEQAVVCIKNQSGVDFNINIIEASVKQYSEIKQLTHISIAGLLKFDICNMLPQYNKILYLDGDIIVRGDLWELFCTELENEYVACVVHSLGIITGERKMNSGVMLLNAKKIREENLRDILFETRKALGERKSMDQETFQIVFGEEKLFLPPKYNIMMDKIDYEKKYYSIQEYNKFYKTCYKNRKEVVDSAIIMHFTGAIKPWKYSFAKGFKEWQKYYQATFGSDKALKLKSRIGFLKEQVKKNGIRALYWLGKDKLLIFMGETLGLYPDKSHGDWN